MPWLFIGAALAAVAVFTAYGKTANTANDLMVNFVKAQIYKFVDGGSMTVRVFVDFTNLHDTKLIIENAALQIAVDGVTIGRCNVNNVEIVKGVNNKYFDLVMPWANLAILTIPKIIAWFSSHTLKVPEKATISGEIKVEGHVIKINKVIPFSGN